MLEWTICDGWSEQFAELMDRLRPRFSRSDLFAHAKKYLRGLLSQVDRKNSWQLAEAVGAQTPHGFQRLLGRARWSADDVRDDLQRYVIEHFDDPQGVLVIDETGFLKKGEKSAGVSRQYSGTAGRIENSQVGVFLAYRSNRGHVLVDRELYLPKSWTEDRERCHRADIPDETEFATKPELARQMLARSFEAGFNVSWVTADEVYGSDSKFRRPLENKGVGYVLTVSCQQRLFLNGYYDRVDEHVKKMPEKKWKELSCGAGSKGQRFYEWAFVPFGIPTEKGLRKGLLVRRSIENREERAYYFTHAKKGTRLAKIVRVAGSRWAVEECFEQAKQEVGLDEYQVRSWTGWYRHITLSMTAHAFLSVMRSESNSESKSVSKSQHAKKKRKPITN